MSDGLKEIIDAADAFQKKFIDPALGKMDLKLDDHLKKMDDKLDGLVALVGQHDAEIKTIKANQRKFLQGAAVYATAVGIGVNVFWQWVRKHLLS